MPTLPTKRVFLLVCVAVPLLMGAAYNPKGQQQDKEELIAKLSSDMNKVDHTIDVTKDLIKRSPDAPYLADLYFRLAELYVEKSRYVFARIMEAQPEGQKSLGGEKSLEVQINKKLAVETYDKILGDFPEYENNDQIRFFKAHEFRELGDWETMLKEYKDLIDKYPKSDWSIEARLIIADYHSDKGELDQAEQFYMGILTLPESHLHDMARYKMAWIRINQEKFKEALALLEAAVTSSKKTKHGAIGDAKKLDVKREALMTMPWPFSEVRKAFQAPEYFRKLSDSKNLYVEVLKKLANRYFIKTEYMNAALLYREVIRLSSDVEQNIEFVQRVYDSVRNMSRANPKRYSHASEDVDAIVKTLARFENHLKFKQEEKEQLEQDFEIRARDLATRLHVEAQKKGDRESAKIAADAYRKYLSLFTNVKERRAIQLNRAEALYQANDYLAAGRQYEDIAKEMPEGNERGDMVYNSILSYHKALEEDSVYRDKHPTKPGLLNKLEVLRSREGLKQLGAFYVKSWPKSDKTPNVKFNIAKMYYEQGEYERAAELFETFVKEYPTHKDMATAGNLALDALHKLDKYDELAKLAQSFVDNPQITDAKFKNDAAGLADKARKRKVEFTVLSASEGEFSQKMLSEWEKNKGTQEGEEYLYTAFVKFKTEGNIAGVFDFGGRIIGAYPESKRLTDVIGTMGSFAVRAADFERAAFLFEEFYRRFPKEKNAEDILLNAATINALLGKYEEAGKSLRTLRASTSPSTREQAHEKLLTIYRDIGDWEQLARVAQTALQDNATWLGADAYLGIAYAEQGKSQLAQKELTKAVRMRPKSEFDQEAQARALFTYGKLFQKDFDDLQFKGADKAQEVLQRKLGLLQSIEEAYTAAIQTGVGDWAIASLHEAAKLYQEFATFIANAPAPDNMSAAEKQQYAVALKAEADPYTARAKEAAQACATKAEQLKIFTGYASACITNGQPTTAGEAKRRRADVSGDEAYQQDLAKFQQQLAKKPEDLPTLEGLARRAMQVGDYHLAKLVLSKAAEVDPRSAMIQNLLGVASWQLGEVAAAYVALDSAAKRKLTPAMANLAALFNDYGYDRQAKQLVTAIGNLQSLDLTSVELHPSVGKLVQEITGAAPAGSGT